MNKTILGLSLIAIFIISIVLVNPAFTVASNTQYDEKKVLIETIEAYKEVVKKLLKHSDANETVKLEIKQYLETIDDSSLESMSAAELQDILDTLIGYFNLLRETITVSPDVTVSIETQEIKEVIESAIKMADSLNLSEVRLLLEEAANAVDRGDLKLAKELIDKAEDILEENKAKATSKETLKAALEILEELTESSGSNNVLSHIESGLENVNETISILLDIRETLVAMNVSQEIIDAIDLAISNLNRTTSILSNVIWSIESSSDEHDLEDLIKESVDDSLWEELYELYGEINETYIKLMWLENISISTNNTEAIELLNTSKTFLDTAKLRLDEAKAQAEAGNYTTAMMLIYEAEYYKDHAEDILDYVKKMLGVSSEDHEDEHHDDETKDDGSNEDEDHEDSTYYSLMKELEEYEKELNQTKARIEYLMDQAVSMNSTEAITFLNNASSLLNEAYEKIDQAKQAIRDSDYDAAKSLLSSVSSLIDNAKEYVDMAEDVLDLS